MNPLAGMGNRRQLVKTMSHRYLKQFIAAKDPRKCARHGMQRFSDNDPTTVERSATCAARYAAKNIVAAGLAKRGEIQVACGIGIAHPVSIMIDIFSTGK